VVGDDEFGNHWQMCIGCRMWEHRARALDTAASAAQSQTDRVTGGDRADWRQF
jgi:hypothetical protein